MSLPTFAEDKLMAEWQPISTAPKDGTRILAYGNAYNELADDGFQWIVHDTKNRKWQPFIGIIKWFEIWYDDEIDLGDGTYKKEPKLSHADWKPHFHAFNPTHWMPLPSPPKDTP